MFGNARWIGGDSACKTPLVRASFVAPAVSTACLTICGLGCFALYVNGRRVSEDLFAPATSDYAPRVITVNGEPFDEQTRHRCYCLRYDVAAFLREGQNELAVELGPGYFAQAERFFDGTVSYGQVRLCYRIEMADAAGRVTDAVSGADARWKRSSVIDADLYRGETHDLRVLDDGWQTAPFEGWQPVSLLPPLETEFNLQDCPTDRIIRHIAPRLIKTFPSIRVYDAGENITGWAILRDEEAAGNEIEVRFSEALDACGAPDAQFGHKQRFTVISDGRRRALHPRFTWQGFRYFSVCGRAEPISIAVIHCDLPPASDFACASPVLNWLYRAYLRTQLGNMHCGIPTDCPHLERKGYTGDGQLTTETMLLALNPVSFLRKWMRDIADCQDALSGHVQYTAPYTRCGGGPGGWGCAIVTVPLAYYEHTGDAEPLRAMYPGMRRYVDYLRAHSEGGLVTSDRADAWCLGDWCATGGSHLAPPFVNTYFLIKSLLSIQRIERILGMSESPEWQARMDEARQAITASYYDMETGDFAGGAEGANAFALDMGLGDERTLRRLIAKYEALGGYDTGIFGTEILTRVLFERGQSDLALRLLCSENAASFAGWMDAGATTLWENWPGDTQRSLNHPMFGAVVKELFHEVLGMRQEAGGAGWKSVRIAPSLTRQIPEAKGYITTPQGRLFVSYRRSLSGIVTEIEIPPGMDAALCLNGREIRLPEGRSTWTDG